MANQYPPTLLTAVERAQARFRHRQLARIARRWSLDATAYWATYGPREGAA